MKKILRIVSFILAALLFSVPLSSCGKEMPEKIKSLPFHEGYYAGRNFTARMDFVGSDVECSYNLSIFNNDTGLCYFKATAMGVSPTAPGMQFFDDMINGDSLAVIKNEGDGELRIDGNGLFDGEYIYCGDGWQSDYDVNKSLLVPGRYTMSGYVLNVTRTGDTLTFSVGGDMSKELFHAELPWGLRETITLEDDGGDIAFTASGDENGAYISVYDPATGRDETYFGTYFQEGYDFLSTGLYVCGDSAINVKRTRDKSDATAYKSRIEFILTVGDAIRMDEILSIDVGTRLRQLDFSGGKIKFFKGCGKNGEYIDVLTSKKGITPGRYVIEK